MVNKDIITVDMEAALAIMVVVEEVVIIATWVVNMAIVDMVEATLAIMVVVAEVVITATWVVTMAIVDMAEATLAIMVVVAEVVITATWVVTMVIVDMEIEDMEEEALVIIMVILNGIEEAIQVQIAEAIMAEATVEDILPHSKTREDMVWKILEAHHVVLLPCVDFPQWIGVDKAEDHQETEIGNKLIYS